MAQPRVFISHATADAEFAERFAEDLRSLGADVWLDSSHMGSGDFVQRINRALLDRDVVILVLSPAALTSQWVSQEVNAAITRAHQGFMRPPLVVLAQLCSLRDIPPLWTVYHRHDATSDYTGALYSVARELELSVPNVGQARSPANSPRSTPPSSQQYPGASVPPTSATSARRPLLRLANRHPIATVVGLSALYALLESGLYYLEVHWRTLNFLLFNPVILVFASVIAVLVMLLGWGEAGFRRPSSYRSLLLGILVLPLPVVRSLVAGLYLPANDMYYLSLVASALCTAFSVQCFWSGLALRAQLSLGPLRAICGTSVLCGLTALNILALGQQPVSYLLESMVGSALFALVYSALRLRTGSIWFGIGLYFVVAVAGYLAPGWRFSPLYWPLTLGQDAVYLVVGLLLAWPLLRVRKPSAVREAVFDVARR